MSDIPEPPQPRRPWLRDAKPAHPRNRPTVVLAVVLGMLVVLACLAGTLFAAGISGGSSPAPSRSPSGNPARSAAGTPSRTPSPPATRHTGPTTRSMPDMVGRNAKEAGDLLTQQGFTNVSWGSDNGKLVMVLTNWAVEKQNVEPGTAIATNYPIVLTLRHLTP